MFRLTREVRFAINTAGTAAVDPQLKQKPTNGYAGFPTATTIASQYQTLAVTLEGELDERTGYLRNIKEIDEEVRRVAIRPIAMLVNGARKGQLAGNGFDCLADIADGLKEQWPGCKLHSLKWNLTP